MTFSKAAEDERRVSPLKAGVLGGFTHPVKILHKLPEVNLMSSSTTIQPNAAVRSAFVFDDALSSISFHADIEYSDATQRSGSKSKVCASASKCKNLPTAVNLFIRMNPSQTLDEDEKWLIDCVNSRSWEIGGEIDRVCRTKGYNNTSASSMSLAIQRRLESFSINANEGWYLSVRKAKMPGYNTSEYKPMIRNLKDITGLHTNSPSRTELLGFRWKIHYPEEYANSTFSCGETPLRWNGPEGTDGGDSERTFAKLLSELELDKKEAWSDALLSVGLLAKQEMVELEAGPK